MSFEFTDNSVKLLGKIADGVSAALEEIGGEIESQAKINSRVDTGQTKGSYRHTVSDSGGEAKVAIGSDYENAIYEEFGTGEFALHGNGRKTPWMYQDRNGVWHRTTGKRPNQPLKRAFDSTKGKIETAIKTHLSDL